MFKKIEVWVLYLVVLLGFVIIIGFGSLVRQELVGSHKLGIISKTALFLAEIPVMVKRSLKSDFMVPDRFPGIGGFVGEYSKSESFLLLARYDAELKTSIIDLIDLRNFNTIHSWDPNFDQMNSQLSQSEELQIIKRDFSDDRNQALHPMLMRDGGLVITHGGPLRKIDACSNLVFQNDRDLFHHSLEISHDNHIWALTHLYPSTLSKNEVGEGLPYDGGYFEDAIVKISDSGEILFEKSIAQILKDNNLEYLLYGVDNNVFKSDPIHANDVQPTNAKSKFWNEDDVFISLRNLSMIILYRPSTNKVIWKGSGSFFHQHDVNVMDDSRISIFNNNAKTFKNGFLVDGFNEMVTYDFESDKYSSYLKSSFQKYEIKTATGGRGKVLKDGSLFVEETEFGRLALMDPNGLLRWTFVNRSKSGKVYTLNWSRVLDQKDEIKNVKEFMLYKSNCDV